eukprot:SAG22_NODE_14132_length_383_cov_1.084507_1_plen_38_part_10
MPVSTGSWLFRSRAVCVWLILCLDQVRLSERMVDTEGS